MPDKDTIKLITESNKKLKGELQEQVSTKQVFMNPFVLYYDEESNSLKIDYIDYSEVE